MTSIALTPKIKTFPHTAYYSTQPFLAWCLNHYTYGGDHYVWASRYLFPYRRPNPKSSSPYQMFQDLYQPSLDHDQFDAFVQQKRINLRAGVQKVVTPTHAFAGRLQELYDICDRIDITFFWPVVYLIDEGAAKNGIRANSALVGSDEVLIPILKEDQFTLLIPDFQRESALKDDIDDFINDLPKDNPKDPIARLFARC